MTNDEATEAADEEETDAAEEAETFSAEYVKQLRNEAAANRVKAKRADDAEVKLRQALTTLAAQDILTDPTDLPYTDELSDDEGWPDPEKIREAAETLVARKPYLGRPNGFSGQGHHSDDDGTVSLSGLLRAGA